MSSAAVSRDSIYQVLDERFQPCTWGDARLEHHYGDCRWAEGPAYHPAGRYLVWSDIPNDRMLRLDETTGAVGVFRSPAGYSNGQTVDRQGRLVTCEHGPRRVTRTEHDGSITVLTDAYAGKRYNSPNDVVVRSDDSIWFTDPTYGIRGNYEGFRADPEQDGAYVFRLDASTGEVTVVADDFDQPNGLAFSPDESTLYVVDSAIRHLRAFHVEGSALSGGEVLTEGAYDGIRVDDSGRIWGGEHDGVHCIDQDGTVIGKIIVPQVVANVVFGGPRRNQLYIAATTSLYSVRLSVCGTPTC